MGNELRIKAGRQEKSNTKVISTSPYGIFTKNNLTHLYQLGYDDLTITCDDDLSVREITKRIHECIGYELFEQRGRTLHIRSISSISDEEFDPMLRKSFQTILEMGDELNDAFEKSTATGDIRQMEFVNNKFTMCCVRILHKYGHHDQRHLMQYFAIVKFLEQIADEYKYMCDVDNAKPSRATKEFAARTLTYFKLFHDTFYAFDAKKKNRIYAERKNLLEEGNALLRVSKGDDSVIIHHLLCIVQKTYDAAGEMFAIQL
jgi:phosphate uptake regulator